MLEKAARRLIVLNDRFNGVPPVLGRPRDRRRLVPVVDLFRQLRRQPGFGFAANTMLQFLCGLTPRLGDATHDTRSRFLLRQRC